MKRLIIFLLFTTCTFGADLPPVIISAKVDKARVTTGDLFVYTVKLDVDEKFSVTLPELGGNIASFRVVDFGKEDPIREEGRIVSSRWYQLQADLTGSYILPALEVKYKDEQGKEVSAKTSEIFIEVASVIKEEGSEGLRDIKGLQASSRSLTTLSYILIAVLIVIVGLIIFLWFRSKRGKEEFSLPLLPHERALQELDAMALEQLDLKPYYFRLTEILKNYFESIYDVTVTDMTLEEIIAVLGRKNSIDTVFQEQFLAIMRESELVKFSDYIPAKEKSSEMILRVRRFVEDTMPKIEKAQEQESVI